MGDRDQIDALERSAHVDADEWMSYFEHPTPADPPFLVVCFPNEAVREACLAGIHGWSENEVRRVLRSMVGDSRDIPGHDLLLLRFVSEVDDGAADQHLREWDRRAIRRYVGKGAAPTWEGLTWILDLLPNEPNDALAVLSNYISVHAQELPDIRLAGLSDAMSIIRNRYLHIDTRTELDLVDLLLSLHWRDFEYFVAAVWAAQGYRVQVTPRSKDRGKDVIATRDGVNAELVFIECKNWRGVVPVGPVRELRGAVTKADANRGVLVATSGFTEGDASATEEADGDNRLTLVDGPELVRLAHTHLGANWARNLDRIVMDMRANTNATRKKE